MRTRVLCGVAVFSTVFLALLTPLILPVTSQPQGYTLVYSAPRVYAVEGADWMNFKALYVKTEGNRLYFYVEYYGAIPSSRDYGRTIYIFADTDRNPHTGSLWEPGRDYRIYFHLRGDNSSSLAELCRWNSTSRSWDKVKDLRQNAKLAPGLSYMEIWVDKQDIGYTQSGIEFYLVAYSNVKAMPKTELSYLIGSSVKQITVDGDASDWGTVAPSVTFPSRSINPPELEVSNIYVANDDENLYVRIDTRGKPTTSINTGSLKRWLYIYLDTDNNNSTGYISCGGAEFRAWIRFDTNPKVTGTIYWRYAGTGSDWNWQQVAEDPSASDFNSVFEIEMPLSYLGLGPGWQVGIYIEETGWSLYYESPNLVYPAATLTPTPTPTPSPTPTPTPSGATGFGSEIVLTAVVIVVIIVIVSVIMMMRKRPPPPPPPPPPPA